MNAVDRADILHRSRSAFLDAFAGFGVAVPRAELEPLVSEQLICPFPVRIPAKSLAQIRAFVKAAFTLRMNPAYLQELEPELRNRALVPTKNHSLFCSYDFHLRQNGTPALIEVNTNASFYGLSFPLHAAMKLPTLTGPEVLRADILREVRDATGKANEPLNVVITDENPAGQRLYAEFLFYKKLFESWGWSCAIRDIGDLPDDVDWVYNRHTDFFLETSATKKLRAFYLSGKVCVSPNPTEYLLLADKQRMIDWNQPGALEKWNVPEADREIIRAILPRARDLTAANADEIWRDRKGFFFKAKRSFGSKQSYKGASVSRRMFDELVPHEIIAQEYVHPSEVTFPEVADLGAYKYDLRIYVDRDEVRGAVARVFQGQVTNTRTPFGGFSPVIFS